MKEKWKRFKDIMCTDTNVAGEKGQFQITIVSIMATAMFCILTARMDQSIVALHSWNASVLLVLVFVLSMFISVKFGKRTLGSNIASVAIGVLFTFYAIKGYSEGFAPIWSVMVPYASMETMGLLHGTCVSGYLLVFYCLVFWTPCGAILQYDYSEVYSVRFPLVYMFCCLISFYTNYRLKQARLYEMKEEERLRDVVEQERRKVGSMTMQTIISISNAVDAKDSYTKKHSERVANYARLIASRLQWSVEEQNDLYNMALLHDIGKIGVPDAILNKQGRLTNDEYPEIKKHPVVGGEILKDFTVLNNVAKGAYYHHERYDGTGYPEGLKGKEIPIEARIIGVADAIDAMNSNRVYRKRKDKEYIMQQLEEGKGTQFDPEIVDLVIELVEEGILLLDDL